MNPSGTPLAADMLGTVAALFEAHSTSFSSEGKCLFCLGCLGSGCRISSTENAGCRSEGNAGGSGRARLDKEPGGGRAESVCSNSMVSDAAGMVPVMREVLAREVEAAAGLEGVASSSMTLVDATVA